MKCRPLDPLGIPLLLTLAGCSRDAGVEFEILAALAQVEQDDQEGFEPVVDDQFGGRLSVGFSAPVARTDDSGSGVRLGGRFAASFFREALSSRNVGGEPLLEVEDFANLTLLSPQLIVGYRQLLGDPDHGVVMFVEPGVGVGPTIGLHTFGSDFEFANETLSTDTFDRETEVSWSLNPYLRLGAAGDGIFIGAEGGYEWTGLEFDDRLGQNARAWYLGLYLSVNVGQ